MAKHLFQSHISEQSLSRLSQLQPDATAQWGSMTAAELLAHLIDAFQVTFKEKEVTIQKGFLSSGFGRWLALLFPIPKGKIKAPAIFHERKPADFDADKQIVSEYIKRFSADPHQAFGPSPLFGHLSNKQWARLHYIHLDHHLRQFGV